MKKAVSMIVAIIMITGMIHIQTYAKSPYRDSEAIKYRLENSLKTCINDFDGIKRIVAKKLSEHAEKMDFSKYLRDNTSVEDLEMYICSCFPESFAVAGIYLPQYLGGRYTGELEFEYYGIFEDAGNFNKAVKTVRYIIGDIYDNEELTEFEKALLIHDRLLLCVDYYFEGEHDFGFYFDPYDKRGAFMYRYCVCSGYADAYSYLCGVSGLRCEYISSSRLNHAWNIVYIDGVPYHVDTTWDDTSGRVGRVLYDCFLLSSDTAYERGHNVQTLPEAANSVKYEDTFLTRSVNKEKYCPRVSMYLNGIIIKNKNPVYYCNGYFYIYDDGSIFRTEHLEEPDGYSTVPIKENVCSFTLEGSVIIYTDFDSDSVYTYDTRDGSTDKIIDRIEKIDSLFCFDKEMNYSRWYYGEDGWLYITYESFDFTPYMKIMRGDCNSDGVINNRDVVALFRFISSDYELDCDPAYDFNQDGKINNKDVAALFKYVNSQ